MKTISLKLSPSEVTVVRDALTYHLGRLNDRYVGAGPHERARIADGEAAIINVRDKIVTGVAKALTK
jgi:hypothetical protein